MTSLVYLYYIKSFKRFIILFIAKPICISRHTAQQNDKALVLVRYNTYQISRCSTTCLWNNLHNEVVLAVKQDRFIVLTKVLCDQ